jgi:hypothetical protein
MPDKPQSDAERLAAIVALCQRYDHPGVNACTHALAHEVKTLLSGGYVGPRPAAQPLNRLEIELPMPPQATHPNARGHWATKAKAVAKQREDAATMATVVLRQLGRRPPLWERVSIQATFYKPGKQAKRADEDGLISWCKASVDGLQGSVIKNDSGVTWLPPVQVLGDAAEERKLVLVVTPILK